MNPAERSANTWMRHIDDLREAMRTIKEAHPIGRWWCCPNTCTPFGACRPGDADYPRRWSLLKAVFSRWLEKANASAKAGWQNVSEASGSDGIGSIRFVMKPIWRGTWMTCITTLQTWLGDPTRGSATFHFARLHRVGNTAPDWVGIVDGGAGYGER